MRYFHNNKAYPIDNTTNLIFSQFLFSDYGFEILWNARKGNAEIVRSEYVKGLGGHIVSFRSRRNAEIVAKTLNVLPLLNGSFLLKWIYNDRYYNLLFDGSTITIRDYDIEDGML